MKKYSDCAADPDDDKVLVPFDRSQLVVPVPRAES